MPPLPKPYGNGYGSVAFPGTGGPPSGRIYGNSQPGNNHHGNRAPLLIPYGVPVYWGGGGFSASEAPPPVQPQQPERQEAAPVIINQYFSPEYINPAMREYASGELPPAAPRLEAAAVKPAEPEREQFYMLAFNDGTVQTVRGYSVEGNTISFVTPYGSVRRVSLDEFDREMTEKLNRGR
ncbi:MAG: hypothetical protein NTY38_18965 [Acidobacteria bacterium]|nr:hypothetical protein [Acidobacteriota bacterium]